MKAPTIQVVQAVCLIGIFAGPLQVLCLQKVPLDMAMNSVDDPYFGCTLPRELKLKKPGYMPLPQKYITTWKTAIGHMAKLGYKVGNFNPTYGTAIMAYTIGDSLYRDFNAAVRNAGGSKHAYQQFPFKDYFLLLNRALQAKKAKKPTCYEVFRGIKGLQFTFSSKLVRFGQFASSSMIQKISQGFGEDTFFSIRTCHGVLISEFSLRPYQKEVVIPPYEKFKVTSYKKTPKGVFVRLESRGIFHRFNCEDLKGH